jgi:hypothetical protein
MWSFESHKKTELNIDNSIIMAQRTGLEARYASRFTKYAGDTKDAIQKADDARKVADEFRTSAGIIETQQENITELFTVAEQAVNMINDFQRQSGKKQVNNIPLPGPAIKESYGKKLGYTKLSIKFVTAGLLHFMEECINMEAELRSKDLVIRTIAEEARSVPVIGKLQNIELDDLNSMDPIVDSRSQELGLSDTESEISTKTSTTSKTTPPASVSNTPKKEEKRPVIQPPAAPVKAVAPKSPVSTKNQVAAKK